MLVLLLAVACGEPRVTGPTAMVGEIVDAEGNPVGGERVTTLETSVVTDTDGRFSIRYKEPDQHVNWTSDRVHWQRLYRPEDDGQTVRITLPETEIRRVHCGVDCTYTLEWTFSDGLSARLTGRCAEGEDHSIGVVPVATPEVSCRGSRPTPVLTEENGGLYLRPASSVEREETDGEPPD